MQKETRTAWSRNWSLGSDKAAGRELPEPGIGCSEWLLIQSTTRGTGEAVHRARRATGWPCSILPSHASLTQRSRTPCSPWRPSGLPRAAAATRGAQVCTQQDLCTCPEQLVCVLVCSTRGRAGSVSACGGGQSRATSRQHQYQS